jgi:hypothetical protein
VSKARRGFRLDSLFAFDQRTLSGNQGTPAKPQSNQLPIGTNNGDRRSNTGTAPCSLASRSEELRQ